MIRWSVIAILAFGLGGCPSNRVVTESRIVVEEVPEYLRSCMGAPPIPVPPRTQRTIARLIVQLEQRGDDCAAKLQALVGITDGMVARVRAFNQQNAPR